MDMTQAWVSLSPLAHVNFVLFPGFLFPFAQVTKSSLTSRLVNRAPSLPNHTPSTWFYFDLPSSRSLLNDLLTTPLAHDFLADPPIALLRFGALTLWPFSFSDFLSFFFMTWGPAKVLGGADYIF